MIFAITFLLSVLILCVTILAADYMALCDKQGINIFEATTTYKKRIQKLEKKIMDLENKL